MSTFIKTDTTKFISLNIAEDAKPQNFDKLLVGL